MESLEVQDGRSVQGQELLSEMRELALIPWRDEETGLATGAGPKLEAMEPMQMAQLMARQSRLQAYLRTRLAQLDANIDLVSSELAQRMKIRGLANIDLPGQGRVWNDGMLLARINPAQLEGAYRWLSDQGMGSMIKPTVNSATLRAQMKRHLQRGGERPPRDLFALELKLRARYIPEERLQAATQRHEATADMEPVGATG